MPALTRRHLLAGAAATGAIAATASVAQPSATSAVPNLTGKSILITGSSSGFGRLGAEHYARLGAKVFATMRNLPRPEADELRELAASERLDITVLELDVTNDDAGGKRRARGGAAGGRRARRAGQQCRHRYIRPGRGAGHGGDPPRL